MLLMNLLPGLRDLRAPLAAGYLWLAAGWLCFAPELPTSINEAQGVLKDIYRVIQASSPVAVLAGLTFAAYIVGILSAGLLTRPIRLIVRYLPIFVLLPLIWLLEDLSVRWPIIEQKLDDLADWADRWRRLLYMLLSIPPSPSKRIHTLVVDRISSKLLTDRESRKIFLDQLKKRLEEAFSHDPPFYELSALRPMHGVRYLMNHQNFAKDVKEEKISTILKMVSDGLDAQYGYLEASERIVKTVVNVDRHAGDIAEELGLTPERLVGDKPATYEQWDRLRAESEFRQAVVPPLLAIIAALFSRGVLSWPFGLFFVVPPLVILAQGIGKENKADSQLIQALEAGIIPAAPIERLTTTDLYWFNSTRSHERNNQVTGKADSEDQTSRARQGESQDQAADSQIGTTKPGGPLKPEG
jgi:hypothetical protein